MNAINHLAGRWNLIKWTAKEADSKIFYPFGEDAIGQIWYDTKGNMMVQIMRRERQLFSSDNLLQGTADEILRAYKGFVAYTGSYAIDAVERKVVHHIKICSFPNWVGKDQVRYYDFKDDLLVLKTHGIGSTAHQLVWQKVS